MRERTAKLISGILNPFLLSAVVMVLLCFKDTPDTAYALKWAAIALAISVLPVLAAVAYLVRRKKLDAFYDNQRHQRHVVYVISSLLGAVGCGLMWGLNAPQLLAVTFTAGLVELIVFMGVNFYWKISLHTAFVAGTVMVLCLVYGAIASWTVIFLPLVCWSRIELKQHSIPQVALGALLAGGIVTAIFAAFGLVG